MAAGNVPIVPWDPNNDSGLVAWKCDCLSEASIAASSGTWINNPTREFDPEKGVRVTAYTVGSFLRFDWRSFITNESTLGLGYQLSFEIETSKLVAFLSGSLYLNGVNATTGSIRFLTGESTPGVFNSLFMDIRVSGFGDVSAIQMKTDTNADPDQEYRRVVSSYGKNFHTRLIIIGMGRLWQLWAEHHDASGKRIGIACLTRSGIDMNPARDKYGMNYIQTSTTPLLSFGGITTLSASGGGAVSSPINIYVRNFQLVAQAPTQVSHPLLRSIMSSGDSYGGQMTNPGNSPSPGKTETAHVGTAVSGGDSPAFVRFMARVVNDTGINTFVSQAAHFGGSTIIMGWGPNRLDGGTANSSRVYLTTDHVVPSATIWSASMAVAVGDFVRPTTRNGFVYVVTVSDGAAGAVEPTWTTTLSTNVSLDGVTYRCFDYDQDYVDNGNVRRGYAKPTLLLHYGGFNDSDYIQRYKNGGNAMYSGYAYADYSEMFDDLWKKWIRALLDQYKDLKILVFTIPASAPSAVIVNGAVTAGGRQYALDFINDVYRSAPSYFSGLSSAYQGRVTTIDLCRMGGWNKIGDYPEDYPDTTHPGSERALSIMANAMYVGAMHMLANGANTVIR